MFSFVQDRRKSGKEWTPISRLTRRQSDFIMATLAAPLILAVGSWNKKRSHQMAMSHRRCRAAAAWVAAALVSLVNSAGAQPPDDLRIRYNSGQPVVPIFEGWERKTDGSFDMLFGYLNRNYVEEVVVPVGPAN